MLLFGRQGCAGVVASASLVVLVGATVVQAATISVINNDSPGEGLNDSTPAIPVGGNSGTTLGSQRFNALQHAADLWAARLTSNVEIRISAVFNPQGGTASSATLGFAGPVTGVLNFSGAPVADTIYPIALANALFGSDVSIGNDDITANFNSDVDGNVVLGSKHFYYGFDGQPGGDIDFVTVALHELGHGLGFLSFVDVESGAKNSSFDDVFMLHLEDHSTGLSWPNMTDQERVASAIDTNDLHWTGSNTVAAAGGLSAGVHTSGHVSMYAPNPLELGSSVSHFDTLLTPNELMEPSFTGANHDLDLTVALFEDLGWVSTGVSTTSSTTLTTTTTTTTTTIAAGGCGQPLSTGGTPTSADALFILKTAVGSETCALCVCDVNSSGTNTTADALIVLRKAVGQNMTLTCPAC